VFVVASSMLNLNMWLLCRLYDRAICDVPMLIRDFNVSLSLRKVDYLILFEFCGMLKNSSGVICRTFRRWNSAKYIFPTMTELFHWMFVKGCADHCWYQCTVTVLYSWGAVATVQRNNPNWHCTERAAFGLHHIL